MSSMTGRGGAGSISDRGALAGSGLDLRSWRIPALILGAVLACIATIAVARLPALTASSTHSSRLALHSHLATSVPITLAPTASGTIGASDHSFWPVRHGSSLLAEGGGIHSTFASVGAALRVSQETVSLSLAGVGRGQRLEPIAVATQPERQTRSYIDTGRSASSTATVPTDLSRATPSGTAPGGPRDHLRFR
jgi:hypothetical protein